ncbi:MAG TPA: helix-turn-helix domain-containing protein [Bryobacteraceae bacterium]|jgi:excisionase family DNA binding protein
MSDHDNRWKQLAQMIAAFIIAEIREQLKNEGAATRRIERRYMTIEEIAEYIGRSKTAVYRLVAKREIPFIRIGRTLRFDRMAIEGWQERGTA